MTWNENYPSDIKISCMANNWFRFKEFTIYQEKAAFKVGTDGVLLGAAADITGVNSIMDIGAGTGLIAIMLAQRCNGDIVAIEPDYDSYIQCCENVNNCRWKERIRVVNTSLQNYSGACKFDLIVTNPPFYTDSLRNPDLRKSASRHNDSLSNKELLNGVSALMAADGRMQLILPYTEGSLFIADALEYGLYCNSILKVRPLPGSEIRRLILTFSRKLMRTREKFLTIEHGKRHNFTEDYVDLTKDFYLKF